MDTPIEKLHRLRESVQSLESALQKIWTQIDEINEDQEFSKLKKQLKQAKKGKANGPEVEWFAVPLAEFESLLEEIPEDGGAAVDFEDAISELIDALKNNN